jgi:hypothetical protein
MIWRVTLLNGLRMYIDLIDNEANDFNYFRGKYSKNKIGSDGKVEIVTLETMKRDTLSNGKIIVRSFRPNCASTSR